ncbi:MAG: hypothetical protein RB191_24535 [Terriglobia bacterium]|nr:hypothetical protein [Terriglobia bacterium]
MNRGNSSLSQSATGQPCVSSGILQRNLTPTPGNLNDDPLIRAAISSSIRACVLSREQIAERMTALLQVRVTAKMLDSYSAESMQANRFPAAWLRAFCQAVGTESVLAVIAEAAGCKWISGEEIELLELGRQTVLRKRAEEAIAGLESRLREVAL